MEGQQQNNANTNLLNRTVSKEFFELGEATALCETAFNPLRFQSKMYGGEFERTSLEIEKEFARYKSLLDNRERGLDPAHLWRELVKVSSEVNRLQGKVLAAFAVGKNSGFDVVG